MNSCGEPATSGAPRQGGGQGLTPAHQSGMGKDCDGPNAAPAPNDSPAAKATTGQIRRPDFTARPLTLSAPAQAYDPTNLTDG